ncbi:MAG: hypothetical protein ABI980_11380 [Nitrospirota bacterium]
MRILLAVLLSLVPISLHAEYLGDLSPARYLSVSSLLRIASRVLMAI